MPLPPLQLGFAGGIELLIVFLLGVVLVAIPAYFVYTDAKKRGNDDTALWTAATIFGGIIGNIVGALLVVILYLVVGREQTGA